MEAEYEMINLFTETLEAMTEHTQSPETVAWVGDRDNNFAGSWEDFAKLANFEYDNGFGGEEINLSLVVVFRDGSWLERHEYDGSEWWEYKVTPTAGVEVLSSDKQIKKRPYGSR